MRRQPRTCPEPPDAAVPHPLHGQPDGNPLLRPPGRQPEALGHSVYDQPDTQPTTLPSPCSKPGMIHRTTFVGTSDEPHRFLDTNQPKVLDVPKSPDRRNHLNELRRRQPPWCQRSWYSYQWLQNLLAAMLRSAPAPTTYMGRNGDAWINIESASACEPKWHSSHWFSCRCRCASITGKVDRADEWRTGMAKSSPLMAGRRRCHSNSTLMNR